MRDWMRRIGPRYVIGLAVIVAVTAAVLIVKLSGTGPPPGPGIGAVESPVPVISASDVRHDADPSPDAPAPPSTSPGAAGPRTVARAFAAAWLHHTGVTSTEWHAAVAKYATTDLSEQLDGADPADVPADHFTGDLIQTDFSSSYVQYAVLTNAGTLALYLQGVNGRWLVSGIDWTRS
jgi:hypothetical protein